MVSLPFTHYIRRLPLAYKFKPVFGNLISIINVKLFLISNHPEEELAELKPEKLKLG